MIYTEKGIPVSILGGTLRGHVAVAHATEPHGFSVLPFWALHADGGTPEILAALDAAGWMLGDDGLVRLKWVHYVVYQCENSTGWNFYHVTSASSGVWFCAWRQRPGSKADVEAREQQLLLDYPYAEKLAELPEGAEFV